MKHLTFKTLKVLDKYGVSPLFKYRYKLNGDWQIIDNENMVECSECGFHSLVKESVLSHVYMFSWCDVYVTEIGGVIDFMNIPNRDYCNVASSRIRIIKKIDKNVLCSDSESNAFYEENGIASINDFDVLNYENETRIEEMFMGMAKKVVEYVDKYGKLPSFGEIYSEERRLCAWLHNYKLRMLHPYATRVYTSVTSYLKEHLGYLA